MNYKNYLKFLLLITSGMLLASCDYLNRERSSASQSSGAIKKDAYRFEMTPKDKNIYKNYLAKLTHKERQEREKFYCGKLAGKTIKFAKDYMFTPFGYADISFLEQNGWKAKMRWCEHPIISYSVVVDWPDLKPGRTLYGFDKLDWGTYDQYLISSQNDKNRDYSNTVIYVFGQLDQFGEEKIKKNPKNLRPYLENIFRKYKVTSNSKAFIRKDLDLEQLEIPISKDKVITIYWHRYNKTQADLVIECKPVPDRLFSWCTSYFFPKNIPNVIASFVVTEDNLTNWPQLVNKASTLFNSFVIATKATTPKEKKVDAKKAVVPNSKNNNKTKENKNTKKIEPQQPKPKKAD